MGQTPWRSPQRNQWWWRPPPVIQQESWIFPLHGVRTGERVRFPIVITWAGQRYCTLPGWQPLLGKSLCLPVSWGKGVAARMQGGKESLMSESRRVQTSQARKIWFWDHLQDPLKGYTQGYATPRLQGGCGLPLEGITLTGSHWSNPWVEAARYAGGTHGDDYVCYLHSAGWGHWGYLYGYCDCLSGESGPQEPLHGGHPPRELPLKN